MSEISHPTSGSLVKTRRSSRIITWVAAFLGGSVLLLGASFAFMWIRMNHVPEDLDTSTELVSSQGIYRVAYSPQPGSISVNQIHSWILHVENTEGIPVENAEIHVNGDMPGHGHGLPIIPQVTKYLGNGDYLVEGMKFHMPGWWYAEFTITANGKTDLVTFNIILD
jgi:hypothetical protein